MKIFKPTIKEFTDIYGKTIYLNRDNVAYFKDCGSYIEVHTAPELLYLITTIKELCDWFK